ncbi:MAG TPA: glucose-6-phosphate dehydrogenase assembly protein OpcA, partial [Rubrobacteraceae bacterium]|nr:glucose-6-phosphate dehydrogenase assembly protein OpcA [Rubrobacteraceae bacterium]
MLVVIGESRSVPNGGAMSAEQIERELARLRMNEDGTLGARASVLNLIVVTDEESAQDVGRVVSELSGRYPSRAILMISDPDEEEANLRIGLSAFCSVRGGGNNRVCAEQITIHAEGPPAGHLESLAGPLLIPDLPVFLWYPNGDVPRSPDCDGMATLADRLIVDSGAAGDCEACLRGTASLLEESGAPALGDLQWAALSPWRSLVADLFAPPERAGELEKIERVEILHAPDGECRALLFTGWLSVALGWHPESAERTEEGRVFRFAGPSGDVTVEFAPSAEAALRRVRLHSEELTFQVSHHEEHADVHSTVMRGDELLGERAVHLGSSGPGALLGEELRVPGRDET